MYLNIDMLKSIEGEVCLVRLVRLSTDNFRLVLHQQTEKSDKLSVARLANDKLMKENCLGYVFPFEFSMSMSPHFWSSASRKRKECKNGNFRLFPANAKQKRQTSVGLLQTEMDVCFPWSATARYTYWSTDLQSF